MAFAAIREFLKLQGIKYQSPEKAGVLAPEMEQYRTLAQVARKEFTELVSVFQQRHPYLEQDRTSQWMNQAQVLRPHFWAYLKGEGTMAEPMFALRLYGDAADFGVSLKKIRRVFKSNTRFSPFLFLSQFIISSRKTERVVRSREQKRIAMIFFKQ